MATQVTVSGTLKDAEGTNLTGTVTFTPSQAMADSAGDRVIATAPVVATLASGAFSIVIYASDDATTSPDGATYTVSEDLTGADGSAIERSFRVEIPSASATLRYEDLVPVQNRPVYSYATTAALAAAAALAIPLTQKAAASGVPSLNASSRVVQPTAYDGTGRPITSASVTDTAAVQAVESVLASARARAFLGGRLSGVGDSIMEGYTYAGLLATASKPTDMSVLTWACLLSGGRLAHVVNHGVGGTTSTECLASISDVLAEGPSAVLILTGTNNPSPGGGGSAITPAQSRVDVLGIVNYLRANDIVPIIGTLVAKDFEQAEIALINQAYRDLAEAEDVELWDFSAALTSATDGAPRAGMTFDGTHTGPLGARTMAERVVIPRLDDVGARPCTTAWLAPWDDDPSNLVAKSCFASGVISGGAPPGFTSSVVITSGTAARTLVDPDAGSEVQGRWLRYTLANLNGSVTLDQTITGWAVGDWLTIAVRCRWASLATGDVRWTTGLTFAGSGGTPRVMSAWGHALVGVDSASPAGDVLGDGVIATLTYQVPAASTSCVLAFGVSGSGSNAGTIDWSQLTIVNHGPTPPGS